MNAIQKANLMIERRNAQEEMREMAARSRARVAAMADKLSEASVIAKDRVKKAYANGALEPAMTMASMGAGFAGARLLTRVAGGDEKGKPIRIVFGTILATLGAIELSRAIKSGRPAKKWAAPCFYVGIGMGAVDAIPYLNGVIDKAYDAVTKKK